jgi:hypothetical protein
VITIEDLREEHLRSLKVRDFERADLGENIPECEKCFYLESEYKKALLVKGEVVMVMGGKIIDDGCSTWLLASDLIYQFPVVAMKQVKKIRDEIKNDPRIKYLYTFNLPEFTREIEFLKRIGFEDVNYSEMFDDGKERKLFRMEA